MGNENELSSDLIKPDDLLVERVGLRYRHCSGLPTMDLREFTRFLDIQERVFGINTPFEVIHQILYEGRGNLYLEYDSRKADKVRGYVLLVTKPLDEKRIQQELVKVDKDAREKGVHWRTLVFTDHLDYPLPEGAIDLHEVGTLPDEQRKGYASALLYFIRSHYEETYGALRWIAFARINNIASLKVLTKIMEMSMVGMQGKTRKKYGSMETNFRGDSNIPSIDAIPADIKRPKIWNPGEATPQGEDFFIGMSQGEQWDLKGSEEMVKMLKTITAVGRYPKQGDYIMRRVCRPQELEEIGLKPDSRFSYLFFTREWENKVV